MNITAALTYKGQITIPIAIRRLLGLEAADRLVFTVEDEKIIATPVRSDFFSLYGSVKGGGRALDFKKVRQKMVSELAAKAAAEGLS